MVLRVLTTTWLCVASIVLSMFIIISEKKRDENVKPPHSIRPDVAKTLIKSRTEEKLLQFVETPLRHLLIPHF